MTSSTTNRLRDGFHFTRSSSFSLVAACGLSLLVLSGCTGQEAANETAAQTVEPASTTASQPAGNAAPAPSTDLPQMQGEVDVAVLMADQALPDVVIGKAEAPITIVEYASMTCDHCAAFHVNTYPTLKRDWIDTGKAKLILREFPFDPRATAAFMLARCAPKGSRLATGRTPLPGPRQLVRKRMTLLALERVSIGAASGSDGDLRFGRRTRVLTRLLFQDRHGDRKAVSLRLHKLLWPLVPEKAKFLVSAQTQGSYCFFSGRLIEKLKHLIDGRKALEIAAGDGTLSRLLHGRKVEITATDDHSWSHAIEYPQSVADVDAETALRELEPEVVVCCWPPAANSFERAVFESQSVVRYIVLGSAHEFASGTWHAFASQKDFQMREDAELSALVLPPEAGAVVRVFDRIVDADRRTAD